MTLLTLPLRVKTSTIHEPQRCKERRGSPKIIWILRSAFLLIKLNFHYSIELIENKF